MQNLSSKTKFRVYFLLVCVILTGVFFAYTFTTYLSQMIYNKNESKELSKELNNSHEEEEELKDEINKLQDSEYMARYAREKYLYSKDDEIIIKIEE